MTILLSITILAFCALLWAAISVARHLRRAASQHHPETTSRPAEMLRHLR